MAKKGGVKKSFGDITKELRAQVTAYEAALKKFGDDLEKLQTAGEDNSPVWNGKRAKAWMDLAVKKVYNINVRDLKELDKAVEGFELVVKAVKIQR